MSFKLLAIRPLKGCNPKILKNLKENQIYQFYNDYEFISGIGHEIKDYPKSKPVKIAKEKSTNVPKDLYGKNINVSAIVGKNGSGKSALIELLIAAIAKISIIIDKDFIKPEELYHKNEDEKKEKYLNNINKFNKSLKSDLQKIKVEIYYQHIGQYANNNGKNKVRTHNNEEILKIRCIELINNTITIQDQDKQDVKYFSLNDLEDTNPDKQQLKQEFFLFFKNLFYTMIINYSHYGFNTNEIGEWIKAIFHKNDGYQLPVVINPYRDKGNININIEKNLAKSRFLVNILQEEKLRTIQKNKTISHITIELDNSKFLWDFRKSGDLRITNSEKDKEIILDLICEKFYYKRNAKINKQNKFFRYALDYVLIKLRKITNYSIYQQYGDCFEKKTILINGELVEQFKIIPDDLFINYLECLFSNTSHITEKFKQAAFFLQYAYIDEKDIKEKDNKKKIIPIDDLYNWLNESYLLSLDDSIERFEKQEDKDALRMINEGLGEKKFGLQHSIPSFFKIEYYFEEKISNNNFSSFSSGEKQKIFSIHSVIYHLRNLLSVQENNFTGLKNINKKLITYDNINIIFDEIELYAHPDFQRTFISDLLGSLESMEKKDYYLNIIFITHSPFILSDIPKENILFLEIEEDSKKAKPTIYEGENTFGANIHEMLTNGFFMESTKGEFALSKINNFLSYYKKVFDLKKDTKDYNDEKKIFEDEKKDFYQKLICVIGEDYVRKILENHLKQLSNHFEIIDKIPEDELLEKKKKLMIEVALIDEKLKESEKDKL